MKAFLRLTSEQNQTLRSHLFPGDGKEAVAFALCGRRSGSRTHGLFVHQLNMVPYERCMVRENDRVVWRTEGILPALLEQARRKSLALVKIHSHPGGDRSYSAWDNEADRELFGSVFGGWVEDGLPHGSVVMMPTGEMFGRLISSDLRFSPFDVIQTVGDDLLFWHSQDNEASSIPEFAIRNIQTFGRGTVERLKRLKIAVVGCSGTGSIVTEQLARLGVGGLVLIDPQEIEEKNLNRILNSTMADVRGSVSKVEIQRRAISAMEMGTDVEVFERDLFDLDVIHAIAECDIVFGCMDGVEGRQLLNRISSFYCLPYFDVGVLLRADGKGGIEHVCGSIHYLQPGKSGFLERRVFSAEDVRAENVFRTDPPHYKEQRQSGYIRNVKVDSPAVISVNMLYAALGVNEFLARLHPYRQEPNGEFAIHRLSLCPSLYTMEPDQGCPLALQRYVGRGDTHPPLDMPELSRTK